MDVRRALLDARELWCSPSCFSFTGSLLLFLGPGLIMMGAASRPSWWVHFPVLTLLPGFIVPVCCVSSLPSYVLCIGRLEPRIWGIFVCYLEVSILFEQWAGQRLLGEQVTRSHVRALRPISISSVPMSFGISSVIGALRELPGGVGRFLRCRVRKSYVWASALGGWEQCSHCLTSRPSGWPASPGPLKFRPPFFPCVPGMRISLFP